ncbi:MAG: FAD-dependent oxidoreductase, partial [Mailhella sp.]|nr:FAD-dependent oxidoreductase [Mailhella sp.]
MNVSTLFEPVRLGPLTLKNRFVMAPMSVHMTEDGSVTDKEVAFVERRAAGGVAMIIMGSLCVRPDGNFGGQLFIEDDGRIAGLRRITDAIHRHDCLAAAQIHHSGRETNARTSGFQPIAPSYFEPEVYSVFKAEYDPPHVMSTEEVREIVECYAQSVRRAKEAGFDLCELHCAHGYLISAFMSPLTNQRTDEYGGSFLARMRFVTEIIRRSRELVGDDYPITCRIVGDEFRENGIDMDLSVRIARYLEGLGVTALSVSAGIYPYVRTVSNMYHDHAVNLYLAENVRRNVSIPVFAAGQLDRPDVQVEAIEKGKADIICIGRTLIADPDYPDKLRDGRLDDICWCIACNKGCHDRSSGDRSVKCAVNVETGREIDTSFALRPADAPKKVMVIGGGPAGMQAAADAARRGHAVSLWDDRMELGGRLRLAAVPPHKARYGEACDYLARELRKLPVDIRLDVRVGVDEVLAEKPDAVIHLAALQAVRERAATPLAYYTNNITGTLTLTRV